MELFEMIKEIMFLERELESAKIDLAIKSDFNVGDAFRMFDVKHFREISQEHLAEGLRDNLKFADFDCDDIYIFFKKIDTADRGLIKFNQFSEAILPYSVEYSALVNNR